MLKKIGIGTLVILLLFLFTVLTLFPKVHPAPELNLDSTPERLARGKYLVNHAAACLSCHSERDWEKFSGPIIEGTEGKGGEIFDEKAGLPGSFIAKNITPAALKEWTDGEIFRAITVGVDRKKEPLFPIMPYPNYSKMADEDVNSMIVYLRTLPEITHTTPEHSAHFPMNLIMRILPKNKPLIDKPAEGISKEYGKYVFTIASCNECHTQKVHGEPLKGMALAGGFKFPLPLGGTVFSSNITPDAETGIGSWSEDVFVKKFKSFSDSNYHHLSVRKNEFNTVMPWTDYAGMSETDLRALYTYLQTVPAINHKVRKFEAGK